jgi:hypothetical protein
MRTLLAFAAASLAVASAGSASAQTAPFADSLVQAPELKPPSRGSMVGQYASVAFGPGDLTRGVFSLPLPIDLPSERGALPAHVAPIYSAEHGLTEWGAGWNAPDLVIYRTRVVGDLDYQTDELTGPWGRMVKGDDGAYYAAGLKTPVRVVVSGTDLVAYLPSGARWTFGTDARITTAAGTFAWYLRDVTSAIGENATFTYTKNASGRPFLTTVA